MKINTFYLALLLLIMNNVTFAEDGMQININAKVHFIVIDPLGRQTGRDPILNQRYKEIPKANYGNSGVDDHVSLDEIEYSREFVTSSSYPPIDGVYHLKITGISSGKYQIYVGILRGNRNISLNKFGYSEADKIFYYKIDYKSNPDSAIVIERIVNSSVDVIRDLDIVFEQGLITTKGIYNSLTQKLKNAQEKHEKGQINAASNQLNAFINEVEVQSGKHITEDAATILIEDAQYLIKVWME